MGYLETRILTNCGDNKPLLVRRYIDDFFGIATSSEEEVKNFIGKFNAFHPSIKVTHEISSSCITFLDINVSLKGTGVSTSVHYKPTDSHAYLNYASSHPPSCKRSIPYSQFTRIRRLCHVCSEEEDFKYQVDNMSGFFTQRGYPENMVDAARHRISTKSRDETLRPRRGNNEARVPFVLTYHPTSELVVKAIRDNLNILQTDETTSDIFSDPPLISYRKDRSLKQVLVKSSLPSLSEEGESSSNSVGTPCRRPRCKTCDVISSATEIKGPKSVWKLNKKFSCTTSDCIYTIHPLQEVQEDIRRRNQETPGRQGSGAPPVDHTQNNGIARRPAFQHGRPQPKPFRSQHHGLWISIGQGKEGTERETYIGLPTRMSPT